MKTRLYKLTTQDGRTRAGETNETVWGVGVTHRGTGEGNLCGPGYIHAYENALLAVFLNPCHANIADPILWEGEGEIALRDHGLKVGCVEFTTLRQIPLPAVTTEQRVRFAILCARAVNQKNPKFLKWSDKWMADHPVEATA
jgi:hypothetical protein